MNESTAKNLNRLRQLAEPITIEFGRDGRITMRPFPQGQKSHPLVEVANAILDRHAPAAQAAEIRAAAQERRNASTMRYRLNFVDDYPTAFVTCYEGGLGPILASMAKPELEAAVAAENARTCAEYEAYRMACAQGVAVPPAATCEGVMGIV